MGSCKAEGDHRGPTCTFKTRTHMVLSQNNWSVIRFSSGVRVSVTERDQSSGISVDSLNSDACGPGGLRAQTVARHFDQHAAKTHIHGGKQSKWQADRWKMNAWVRVLVVILGEVQWGWRGVSGVWACHALYSELETTVRAPAIEIKGCHFSCVIKPSVLRSPSLELW